MKHQNYNVDHLDFNHYPGTGVALVPLPAVANASYNYKYNGKELQEELGLNMYDYGARNYDAALGRWMNVDPLAEVQPNKTPYHYCSNNPVSRTDPTGMIDGDPTDFVDKDGNLVYSDNKRNGDVFIVNENYKFNGNVKELKTNSKQIYDNWKLIGTQKEGVDYVVSVAKNQGILLEENNYKPDFSFNGFNQSITVSNTNLFTKVDKDKWSFEIIDSKFWELKVKLGSKNDKNYFVADYLNLVNTLQHEKNHYDNSIRLGKYLKENGPLYFNSNDLTKFKNIYELDAIKFQRGHGSWCNTTKKFKSLIQDYEKLFKN